MRLTLDTGWNIPGGGMSGPPPKRSTQRRRTNKPEVPVEVADGAEEVAVPPADDDWHPLAVRWYESLAASGQSVFYEPSDWATAALVAESMSRELNPQPVVTDAGVQMVTMPPKAAAVSGWLKAMTALMVTEGDRRRLRLELVRSKATEEAPDVSWIDDARNRLRSSG